MIWLPAASRYITPFTTSASLPGWRNLRPAPGGPRPSGGRRGPLDQVTFQAGCSRETFSAVTCFQGRKWSWPDRPHMGQSPSASSGRVQRRAGQRGGSGHQESARIPRVELSYRK
jgi:hypothetical protein